MAGVGSTGAAGGGGGTIAALIDAEFAALAADAQALQGLLSQGDVVQARVLPSNGLTDLIEIGGLRVAASLPPNLRPGDVIAVTVTAIGSGTITVQVVEGQPPAPGAAAAPLPSAATGAPSPLSSPPPPAQTDGSVAPPASVFAAAAVRSSAPAPTVAPALRPIVPVNLGSIEARLATARATIPPPAAPDVPNATAGTRPFSIPPIVTRAATPLPAVSGTPSRPPAAPALPPAPAVESPARGLAAYREPVALLRSLRLPVTATNVAAAKTALESPASLPNALATLQRALPGGTDPRVTTLRTIAAFVGHIEPGSPVLAAQLSAFVDNVVTGAEPKLAQLLKAQAAATANAPADEPAAATDAAGGRPILAAAPRAVDQGPHAPLPVHPLPSTSSELATVAERQTALNYDLKAQLLSLSNAPPAGGGDALKSAVSGALTAITALQVNAAQLLAAAPDGFSFVVPLALPTGTAQARVRIDRDAPTPSNRSLDGDNFHIAFVLDTAHLGTIAIDLLTVGRSVTVEIKTEATPAARAFGGALEALTTRLETLRYRVAKAAAAVAPAGIAAALDTVAGPETTPATATDPSAIVDRRA